MPSTVPRARPPLKASDGELLRRYYEHREPRVREQLVERYLPLARKLALRYSYTHESIEDLVQVASVGLLKAIERFSPERGCRFTSFAAPTILGELKRHFRDKGWAIHVPRDIQERALAVSRQTDRLSGILGRSPTVQELADSMRCDIEEVLEGMMALRSYDAISLDAPVAGEEEEAMPLGELLVSRDGSYEQVENRQVMVERWRSLTDLERRVIELRLVHEMTQREIGQEIGFSQMHVSRLLRRSLSSLDVAAA